MGRSELERKQGQAGLLAAGAAAAFCAIIAFQGMSSGLIRGALLLAIAQVVGYGLFWLLWAVRHKSEDA